MRADGPRRSARERAAARRAAQEAARAAARQRRRTPAGGVAAAVLVVVAVVVVVLVQTQRTATSSAAAQPAGTTDGGTALVLGPDGAPVTVDVHEDFLCPHCARFVADAGATLEQLAADGTVQVRHHAIAFLDRASGDDVERGIRELRFGDRTAPVTDAAGRGGVTGTPTVLVDGEPLPGDRLGADGVRAAVGAAAAEPPGRRGHWGS